MRRVESCDWTAAVHSVTMSTVAAATVAATLSIRHTSPPRRRSFSMNIQKEDQARRRLPMSTTPKKLRRKQHQRRSTSRSQSAERAPSTPTPEENWPLRDGPSASSAAMEVRERGDLDAAFERFSRLLELKQALLGWWHAEVGQLLCQMGDIARQQGRDEKALALYTRALPVLEHALGAEHAEVGALLGGIGIAQVRAAAPSPPPLLLPLAMFSHCARIFSLTGQSRAVYRRMH